MKKIILFLLLVSGGTMLAWGQPSTDDMLKAPRVRDFVQLRADPVSKQVFYQLDKTKGQKFEKQFRGPLTVTAKESSNTIVFQADFLNPLQYKITAQDTTLIDPAYQNLNNFFQAAVGFLQNIGANNLAKNAAAAGGGGGGGAPAGLGALIAVPQAPGTTADVLKQLKAPSLAEWRFLSLSDVGGGVQANSCKADFKAAIIDKLYSVDALFYDGGVTDIHGFIGSIKDQLDRLSAQGTVVDFAAQQRVFDRFLNGDLKTRMDNAFRALDDFSGAVKQYAYTDANLKCAAYLAYSKTVFDRYVAEVTALKSQWNDTYSILTALNEGIGKLVGQSAAKDNSIIVARVPVDSKNFHQLTISIKERSMQVSQATVKLTEAATPIIIATINVMAYRALVPEFSTGIFYTNVAYPKYGTQGDNGKMTVVKAGEDRIYYVAAAHLNLILNASGGINPLWQIGFGTGKDYPSLLSGFGIRLSQPQRMVIAGGCMWSWVKELDKLTVGGQVASQADLESDLKYQLRAKPSLYLGVQYNF